MAASVPSQGAASVAPAERQATSATLPLAGRKLLICGMNYAPEITSTGRYTGDIGAAMAAMGAEVEVIAPPPHYPGWFVRDGYKAGRYAVETIAGARVYRTPILVREEINGIWRLIAPLSYAVSSTPVALWRLIANRPDVLLCIEPTLFGAPAAALMARLRGVRTVLHVQDLEIDAAFEMGHLARFRLLRRFGEWFERQTLRLFDRVVTISNAMHDRLLGKGVSAQKLTIIRNWVDVEKIRPLPGPNGYRTELGIGEGVFVVEYAGNLGPKQALDVLLGAAERLSGRSDILFIIGGEGPERARLVEGYGKLANVRFIGVQPEERLCELLNLADVHVIPQLAGAADLVLPSKLGGILASGRQLIVTVDEQQELARFLGDAAALVPPGDTDALADAIARLADGRPDLTGARRAELARTLSSGDALGRFAAELFGPARTSRATPGLA